MKNGITGITSGFKPHDNLLPVDSWWELGEGMGFQGDKPELWRIECAFCGEQGNFGLAYHAEKKNPNSDKKLNFDLFKEGLDLSTPTGRLMFHIVGAIAEFERELIRERVGAGMQHARSKGRKLGRPTSEVDMRDVSARRAAGQSLRAIARDLGCSPALLIKRSRAVA